MLDAVARCVLRGTTFCERDVFLGVCFAWQAQRIHTLCGRDSILVTCVENSWQEQHLVRCVCGGTIASRICKVCSVLFLCYRW